MVNCNVPGVCMYVYNFMCVQELIYICCPLLMLCNHKLLYRVTCLLGDTMSGNLYQPPLGLQYSKFGNCVTLLFHHVIFILPCW